MTKRKDRLKRAKKMDVLRTTSHGETYQYKVKSGWWNLSVQMAGGKTSRQTKRLEKSRCKPLTCTHISHHWEFPRSCEIWCWNCDSGHTRPCQEAEIKKKKKKEKSAGLDVPTRRPATEELFHANWWCSSVTNSQFSSISATTAQQWGP